MSKLKTDPENSLRNVAGAVMLVGAGKMGGALLQGWLDLGLDPAKVVVIEPEPAAEIAALAARGAKILAKPKRVEDLAALFIAVKPQVAADAVAALKGVAGSSTVVVSVMAGKTIGFLATAFPEHAVVRAMPNTPAAVARGITVAVPNARVKDNQRAVAQTLLAAVGAVEWVDDEGLIDAVTAVSGSGPAYVFLLAECLARAGAAAGLPAELSARLARATVAGSGELLYRSPHDAATLRENVTSQGGTTAAALAVLMAPDGLDPLMNRAVAAATRRSRELAG
jgi:pyrroline-5-carboxylate reductase